MTGDHRGSRGRAARNTGDGQVERWFALIGERAIRRGSTRSVRELVKIIETLVEHHNRESKPIMWTATADSIPAKLERLSQRISGTAH